MVNAEMRITTSVYHSTKSWQGGSANLINDGDNLRKTKLPDAKQWIKYLFDGEHSSNIAQICM